jgi:GDPmannose 4,6-dehydratase
VVGRDRAHGGRHRETAGFEMSKTVLITGVTGQDGSYLAELMLKRGDRVVGGVRRTSSDNTWRLAELGILSDVELIDLDVAEITNILRMIERTKPDEIYNLAAQSFVRSSFEQPIYTADIDAVGPARILETIRTINPAIRFYQASTSEMYGKAAESPQSEHTPFHPRSPYAVSKLYAHWITINYRESYGLHACCGILFNHESPLRGREFVTRKITSGLAQVKHGQIKSLAFGNLDARRDWGYAGEYVDGIRRILQAPQAADYVLATGQAQSVRHFIELAAPHFGFTLAWKGAGAQEIGVDTKSGRTVVEIDPSHYRPAEVDALVGAPGKAAAELGWRATVLLPDLVAMMAEADDRRVRDGKPLN